MFVAILRKGYTRPFYVKVPDWTTIDGIVKAAESQTGEIYLSFLIPGYSQQLPLVGTAGDFLRQQTLPTQGEQHGFWLFVEDIDPERKAVVLQPPK